MGKKKVPEVSWEGLGDITEIFESQGVSDLGWLNVTEEDYRAAEAMPKQNLDAIPELQEALTYDDDMRVPSLIPLRPHTVVNSNPLDRPAPPARTPSSIVGRVSTYVMSGMAAKQIQERLQLEFSVGQLRAAADDIRDVLMERGALGNIYVNAAHFPKCAQKGPHRQFVARFAKRALFVLAKDECGGCVHGRGGKCGSFGKRIVDKVPYTQRVYAHYLPQLASERRVAAEDVPSAADYRPGGLPMSDRERKERLRAAFNRAPIVMSAGPIMTIRQQARPARPTITEQDRQDYRDRQAAAADVDPMPSPIYLLAARKIMAGLADPASLIASSDPEVRQLAHEHGILGHTYLDADALGGIRSTIDLIRARSLSPDFVLLRRISTDIRESDAYAYLTKLTTKVVSRRQAPNQMSFIAACSRAHEHGRMTEQQMEAAVRNAPDGSDWARLTAQANLYRAPEQGRPVNVSMAPRGRLYYGEPGRDLSSAPMNPEEVRRTISHFMNTGLYGKQLQAAILKRYSREDLRQVPEVGRQLALDDGVQVAYFIDPTAYRDYGKGCVDGSKLRKRDIPYIFAGFSCTGCRSQTAPSWCNKYAKRIIRQVPEKIRREASERRQLPVVVEQAPVENPVEKWELSSELPVDLDGAKSRPIEVTIPSREVTD